MNADKQGGILWVTGGDDESVGKRSDEGLHVVILRSALGFKGGEVGDVGDSGLEKRFGLGD